MGEWSDWVPVEFRAGVPTQTSGARHRRFYLKRLDPYFELYVSPLNIDPLAPALPVSSPDGYAAELAQRHRPLLHAGHARGHQEPQDRRADARRSSSTQARIAGDENRRQYRYVLDRFTDGLLFYYFGNVDQVSHMMWRARDPRASGLRRQRIDPQYADVVEELYVGLDAIVGETLDALGPDDLLVVMSDHGFTSWRRAFHLNSWLRDNGYLDARRPARARTIQGCSATSTGRGRAPTGSG